MSYRVVVVCSSALARGFLLAGIEVMPEEPESVGGLLSSLVDVPDVGVILIEDDLYGTLSDELLGRYEQRARPMLVPFPSPGRETSDAAQQYIADVLERAIGYRVRAV